MRNISILILTDDVVLERQLYSLTSNYSDNIYQSSDGIEGWNLYKKHLPQIIICNHELLNLDGLSLVEKIRQRDRVTQIIFLSFSKKLDDLLKATELHLVSYVLKPIKSFESITQKLTMVIREIKDTQNIYLNDGLLWKRDSLELYRQDSKIELSESEIALLSYLISHANHICSYESIYYAVCAKEEFSKDAVNSLVKRLRQKSSRSIVKTVYKIGYKIDIK